MRQGKVKEAIRYRAQGSRSAARLGFGPLFPRAAYMVATEHDIAAYQLAATQSLGCNLGGRRWGATWLCLGEIAAMCGDYDSAEAVF